MQPEHELNKNIKDDYNKVNLEAFNYANNKLGEKIKNNTLGYIPRENPGRYNLDRQQFQAEYKHNWLKDNAKKYGYIYERRNIK